MYSTTKSTGVKNRSEKNPKINCEINKRIAKKATNITEFAKPVGAS